MKIFDSIKVRAPKKNKFDLTHERKMTIPFGKLVPFMVQEIVPGDSFRANAEMLLRFSPLLAPVMHRINIWAHYFYVPNRIVWDEWQDFITGGPDGQSSPYLPAIYVNQASQDRFVKGTLSDYLGFPVIDPGDLVAQDQRISALPYRAYQLIYDEFFRDQNLEAPVGCSKLSGDMNAISGELDKLMTLRTKAWEKDYFTSALPWAQRGGDVLLPTDVQYRKPAVVRSMVTGLPPTPTTDGYDLNTSASGSGTDGEISLSGIGGQNDENVWIDNIEGFSTTINDLRRSVRLQEWLEKNARGGARYVEQLLSHFGVLVPDSRLQRPEFLGGGRIPVSISEVLSNFQFSGDAEGKPQGWMAGHGISVGSAGFKKSFVEHGFVIGVMSVLPRTAYQQGIPKWMQRTNKLEYYWPEFANIGEQEVLNKELYFDVTNMNGDNEKVFGYQSRYAEYKYSPSTVHGEFTDTLDFWHMGRKFASAPALNSAFVQADPTNRIFAVTDQQTPLYVQILNKVDALRPMPYYGTPRL